MAITAQTQNIHNLSAELDLHRYCTENIYRNAGMLLHAYRDVQWRLSQSLYEIEDECLGVSGLSLKEALGELLDMDTDLDKLRLTDRLQSLEFSRQITEVISKSLIMLRDYPNGGEHYYDIINKAYLLKYKYSENEILDALNISRSAYYKQKKKAVSVFGVILWGFTLPSLMVDKKET
jgi:hypothetical protein